MTAPPLCYRFVSLTQLVNALSPETEAEHLRPGRHPASHPQIFPTSSETGEGIAELRTAILEAVLA